jgi:hypothetical protein
VRRRWQLTDEGKKFQDKEENETVADRGGATGKKAQNEFYAIRGQKRGPTVPCAFCGQIGDVHEFADGRQPKGKRHPSALHENCAEPYFTGKPKPPDDYFK